MDTCLQFQSAAELTALGQFQGLSPLDIKLFQQQAPDRHLVLINQGSIVAHCSLWWRSPLRYSSHQPGFIGHYAAQSAAAPVLLQSACDQLAAEGCTMAIAPLDGNTWRSYRFITDRGTEPPFFLEPNHPAVYPQQFLQVGFMPFAHYSSAIVTDLTQRNPRLQPVAQRLSELGVKMRSFFGESPKQQIGDDLHRFKLMMKTGEIAMAGNPKEEHRNDFTVRQQLLRTHQTRTYQTMKAVCWQGAKKVEVENVPDPKIINPRDAIVKITSTAICGSDLHLYDGWNPTMKPGDILGHEFMGEIVELGSGVKKGNPRNNGEPLAVGDRVVVPFTISCGSCFFCNRDLWSLCDNSNPNAWMAEAEMGHSPSGLFGYSHLTGGYAGGQAQYARVPFADVGLFKIPAELTDEQVLFLTDIFPTGYMAAENCDIQPGDTVAIWGCGPVGQFAIRSAFLLGAERVIAIDLVPERLQMAKDGGAEVLNISEVEVGEALKEMTGGLGPDSVMDAVGMEAHGFGLEGFYDKVKQAARLETDRPNVLRQAILACRKGGTVSVPGVYTGFVDKVPMGAFMNKGLTMKTGQTHIHRYLRPLTERIQKGEIDPSFLITHTLPIDQAPHAYEIFKHKQDNCIKVVLKPNQAA